MSTAVDAYTPVFISVNIDVPNLISDAVSTQSPVLFRNWAREKFKILDETKLTFFMKNKFRKKKK